MTHTRWFTAQTTYFTHHHSEALLSDFFPEDGFDHWAPSHIHSLSATLTSTFLHALHYIEALTGVRFVKNMKIMNALKGTMPDSGIIISNSIRNKKTQKIKRLNINMFRDELLHFEGSPLLKKHVLYNTTTIRPNTIQTNLALFLRQKEKITFPIFKKEYISCIEPYH